MNSTSESDLCLNTYSLLGLAMVRSLTHELRKPISREDEIIEAYIDFGCVRVLAALAGRA